VAPCSIGAYFSQAKNIKRLREGPLGDCIDLYASRLVREGYGRPTAWRCLRLIADLSRWLGAHQLGIPDLDEELVARYLAVRRRPRACAGHSARSCAILGCKGGSRWTSPPRSQRFGAGAKHLYQPIYRLSRCSKFLRVATGRACLGGGLRDFDASGPSWPASQRSGHVDARRPRLAIRSIVDQWQRPATDADALAAGRRRRHRRLSARRPPQVREPASVSPQRSAACRFCHIGVRFCDCQHGPKARSDRRVCPYGRAPFST